MIDEPWTFTVTWAPETGPLPTAIIAVFPRSRSEVTPGKAVMRTDEGHATYYVRAVRGYVQKYHPGRDDITPVAERMAGEPA